MQRKRDKRIYLSNYKMSNYIIDSTVLRFDLDEKNTTIKSEMTIRKNPDAKKTQNELMLNGIQLNLDSIKINEKELNSSDYTVTSSTLTIKDAPKSFKLTIKNHLNPKKNKSLEGLYITKSKFCTLCEPDGFSKITYFIDRPDVQSTYKTTIVAKESQYPILISNGSLAAKGKLKNGKHWVTWSDPIKKPSYLFAIVAGDFDCFEDTYETNKGRKIALKIYVDKGKKEKCAIAMNTLKKAMRWDENTYGRECDLNEYKLIGVRDFDPAADENTGMNIFGESYLLSMPDSTPEHNLKFSESVVAHEYFHHWSGNRVTIRDWFQICVKEGLTTFREQSFMEDTFSRSYRIDTVDQMKNIQFKEDEYPARPDSFIKYENFQENAVSSIYSKGAEIFRMLKNVLGKETFQQGMKHYFDTHRGDAVTIEDYLKSLEEVSGRDLSQFIYWFTQAGTPTLELIDEYDPKKKTYTLKAKQTSPSDFPENKPLPIPIKMCLLDEKGKEIQSEKVLILSDTENEFTFKNVRRRPIPSLMREFSAPVKLSYQQKDEDDSILMKYDDDPYNRFQASRRYLTNTLVGLIEEYKNTKKVTVHPEIIDVFRHLLNDKKADCRLISKMLLLPDELELSEITGTTTDDINAIRYARECLVETLAEELRPLFLKVYHDCHQKSLEIRDPLHREDLTFRNLKKTCLLYLASLEEPDVYKMVLRDFDHSLHTQMTDSIDNLFILINSSCKSREEKYNLFYQKWEKEPETLSDILSYLAATFICNSKQYHASSGQGYAFVSNMVMKLDTLSTTHALAVLRVMLNETDNMSKQQLNIFHQQLVELSKNEISSDLQKAISIQLNSLAEEEEKKELPKTHTKKIPDKKPMITPTLQWHGIDLQNKTNRQIHNLLKKQGLFSKKTEVESSGESCEKSKDEYRTYVKKLLISL